MPGDDVVSASGQGAVRIRSSELFRTAPATVYNLGVEPGRAYFVGASDLLVHNTDCWRQRRELLQVNDLPESDMNCTFCTLAALNDISVAELTARGIPTTSSHGASPGEFHRLLARTGAIQSREHPTRWRSPPDGPGPTTLTLPQELEQFIRDEHDQSNTFAIAYSRPEWVERPPRSGRLERIVTHHAIIAVRLNDGETVYIDFQTRPPTTSRTLNPHIDSLTVWRTTTDYRNNLHMLSALNHGGRPVRVIP